MYKSGYFTVIVQTLHAFLQFHLIHSRLGLPTLLTICLLQVALLHG